MAPPTRLRPHLDELLQKNLELEHVVADLRHQLTQSSAKWADERKTLAVGCDTLMASFAKFRARLDVQPLDWGEGSEGEVELNLDTGRQSEEAGDVDNRVLEAKGDQGSATEEMCRVLAGELQAREEELEESRRKREAAEEELQRVQQSLDIQSEQLRAALASSKADTNDKASPERTPDNTSAQVNSSKAGPENTHEKLELANQEINRLKQLLQEWKKYGNDWKRDGQIARVRASELQRREDELSAQVKAAEDSKALQDVEIQRLASVLADQAVLADQQRVACQESAKRVRDLETTVARLRAQLSPEQLSSFDSSQNQVEQNEAGPGPSSTESPTPQADTNTNKRSDPILLKIPYRSSIRKPSTEGNAPRAAQQTVTSSSQQVPATRPSPVSQRKDNRPDFNRIDFEVCIHTCNRFPCRNDSRSFLWPRGKPSLPRHVLSANKHHLCSPGCPGYRFISLPLSEAMREPRKTKCRLPTEAEVTLAIKEANKMLSDERRKDKEARAKETSRSESSGEPEEVDEPEGNLARDEENEEREVSPPAGALPPLLGKRVRSRMTDEESQRARKLRPRISTTTKS